MMKTPIHRYFDRFFQKLDVRFFGDVLDVGCGDGRIAARIARSARSVTAIDAVANDCWSGAAPSNVTFSVADAETLPFADETFDCVVAVNMLHHTERPERAVTEMRRVCKTGGTIVVVEPNRYNPLGYVHLTLMGNHQHFPTKRFEQIVLRALDTRISRRFECHCYPVPGGVLSALEALEDALDVLPLWRPFLFYNVAVAIK